MPVCLSLSPFLLFCLLCLLLGTILIFNVTGQSRDRRKRKFMERSTNTEQSRDRRKKKFMDRSTGTYVQESLKMSEEAGLQKLKVAELRSKLEEKGLDTKGTKPTLVARLMGVLDQENNKVEEGEGSIPTPVKQRQSRRTSAVGGGAGEEEGTPVKKSRRLSGALAVAEERPMTPTRKSRRLSVDMGVGERPMTPTRQTRRLSEALVGDERPLTPTRQSRRLSGAGLEEIVGDRPATPVRGSRRLSGGGLEEQLDVLESGRKRTSARGKRLSGLGGIVEKPLMEAETIEEETEIEDDGNNDQAKSTEIEESLKSTQNSEANKEQNTVEESSNLSAKQDEKIVNDDIDQTEGISCDGVGESTAKSSEENDQGEMSIDVEAKADVKEICDHAPETTEVSPELNNSEKEKDPPSPELTGSVSTDEQINQAGVSCGVVEEETSPIAVTSDNDSKSNASNNMEIIENSSSEETNSVSQESVKNVTQMNAKMPIVEAKVIPRQKPKSGKFWKGERGQFRQIKKDRGQRLTFDQRLKMKEDKLRSKELAAHLLGIKNQKKEEMRLKIEENKKKKLENERKAEHFQIIKNPAKIKRMKKKQLRMLEKRDTLAQKQ